MAEVIHNLSEGSIELPQVSAPSDTTDKLYNVGGAITFAGTNISAGLFIEDGDQNIIGGTGAGANLTGASAIFNFLAGIDAGSAITTGDYNVAIGHRALHDASAAATGVNNIAIGRSAMASAANTTANNNIALGLNTLDQITTASDNIAIGQSAGHQLTTASNNVMIGFLSASDLTTGGNNTFLGSFSGRSVTTSLNNTALGYQALGNASATLASPAGGNVAIGSASMSNFALGAATDNTAIGSNTLNSLTTGDDNIAIGFLAGNNITTGDGNTMIGSGAGPTANQSDRLYIHNASSNTPLIFGDFSTLEVIINGDLEVTGAVVSTIAALADSATPSVADGKVWLTGGTTTITDFTGGVTGQEIIIMSEHAITITDGTNMFLDGSANFVMADTDSLYLIQKADGNWYEISRTVS